MKQKEVVRQKGEKTDKTQFNKAIAIQFKSSRIEGRVVKN